MCVGCLYSHLVQAFPAQSITDVVQIGSPASTICLSSALRENLHLHELVLDGNNPSLEGFSELVHALNVTPGANERVICCACTAGSMKVLKEMPKPKKPKRARKYNPAKNWVRSRKKVGERKVRL